MLHADGWADRQRRMDRHNEANIRFFCSLAVVSIKADSTELRYESVDWLFVSARWLVLVPAVTEISIPYHSQFLVHLEKCFVLKIEIEDVNFSATKPCVGGDNYMWKIQRSKEAENYFKTKLRSSKLYQYETLGKC